MQVHRANQQFMKDIHKKSASGILYQKSEELLVLIQKYFNQA
jgi:hypothetical protein